VSDERGNRSRRNRSKPPRRGLLAAGCCSLLRSCCWPHAHWRLQAGSRQAATSCTPCLHGSSLRGPGRWQRCGDMSTGDYARLTPTEDVEEEDDARVHQQAERAAVADMRAAVAEMRATIAPHGAGELLALQGEDGFARPSPSAKPEGKYTATDDGGQQPARVAQGSGPPADPSLDEPAANVDRGARQGQQQQQQQQEERGGPGRMPFRPGGTPSPGVSTSLRNTSSVLSTTKNQKKRSSKVRHPCHSCLASHWA
jgi:hypothetical protein